MSFKWQRNQVQMLIQLLEDSECLYNIDLPSYADRNERKAALNDIYETMRDVIPPLTMDDLRKKLKCIRTQYLQEIRQIEMSKETATKPEEIYKSKLWCFEQLKFLKPFTRAKKIANTSVDDYDESTSYIDTITTNLEKTLPTGQSAAQTADYSSNGKTHEYIQHELQNIKEMLVERKAEKRRYDWLGKQVSEQMEEIDPAEQPKAVLEIQTIIYNYLQLTANNKKPTAAQPQKSPTSRVSVASTPKSLAPRKRMRKPNSRYDSDEDYIVGY